MTATITARSRGPHPASKSCQSSPSTFYTERGPACTSRQEMQIVGICLCSAQLEMRKIGKILWK